MLRLNAYAAMQKGGKSDGCRFLYRITSAQLELCSNSRQDARGRKENKTQSISE
jgi:hypothetical protein